MKKKWLIVSGVVVLTLALVAIAFAANPIKLIVNDQEIKPDVPPEIINGRTMVPLRWVAEALGANVQWDAGKRQVRVSDRRNIWDDPVAVTDPKVRDAVSVISRYFAYLIGYSPEELTDLATANALNTDSPNKIWQPFMFGAEHVPVGFEILDVRKVGENVEVATRLYQTNTDNPSNSATFLDEIYTVVFVPRTLSNGAKVDVPLIDGVRSMGNSGVARLW